MAHGSPRSLITRLGIGMLAVGALAASGNAVFASGDSTPTAAAVAARRPVDPPVRTSPRQEERNERVAVEFMELAINDQQPQEATDRYMGDTFIQHNPQNPDGPEAFVSWATGLIATFPDVNVDVKRTLSDGDLVSVHSHFTLFPGDLGFAVVDIFRFENGEIVEHWDVSQAVPETSANDNTMF